MLVVFMHDTKSSSPWIISVYNISKLAVRNQSTSMICMPYMSAKYVKEY